jgi:5'-3' exonuclease
MIVIDYSGVSISAITGFSDDLKKDEEHIENLIRHVIISTIKKHKRTFKKDYGNELVIAVDSAPYWRTSVFPYYKAGRKKKRDKDDIPWELIYKYMEITLNEINEHLPWKVVRVSGAEADDVIAVMAQDVSMDTDKTLIISSDKDLKQLLVHPNIRQWSPRNESYIKLEESPRQFLRRLILTGDASDGIPNVFSPEDSFVNGIRQSPATAKKLQPLLEAKNLMDAVTDDTIRDRITLNTRLIAFNSMPSGLRSMIIEEYERDHSGTKMTTLKYLMSRNMKLLVNDIEDF